jgi:hypothetical protein
LVEPRRASIASSGCGMRPSTLRFSLNTPAIWLIEPLRLCSGASVPSGAQ